MQKVKRIPGCARIVSNGHPVVKLARALGSSHGRRKHGLVLLEGLRAAEAVLAIGVRVRAALVAPGSRGTGRLEALVARLTALGVPAYELPGALYGMITQVEAPQGVALLCAPPCVALEEALQSEFVLVADRLQDPGNLGAVMRAARAFGVGALVTTPGSVEAANPKAVRAAAGAWPGLPLVEGVEAPRLRDALNSAGFRLLVSDSHSGADFRGVSWLGRVALVLGSEAHGVSDGLSGDGLERVRIPLDGRVESLNVAAAAAVLLAEAARSRAGQNGIRSEGRSGQPGRRKSRPFRR